MRRIWGCVKHKWCHFRPKIKQHLLKTKMTSRLCRSRDVFLKCPLMGGPKICITNCTIMSQCSKNDKFSPNCCSEEVTIWENNKTFTNRPHLRSIFQAKCKKVAEIVNMVEMQSTYHAENQAGQPCTRLRCQSLSSLPHHAFTEIRQCAKDGCTLEDLSPITERKVLQCAPTLNPLLRQWKGRDVKRLTSGRPPWWGQGDDNTSTHLTQNSDHQPKPYSKPYEEAVDEADLNVNSKVVTPKSYISWTIETSLHIYLW